MNIIKIVGGRKAFIILLGMILVALKNVLALDADAMSLLKWLIAIGVGAIAVEDSVTKIRRPSPEK